MTVRAELVSGILPVREDGRMLLLQRPTGTWEPPAGRLAPGESFEGGAVRDVRYTWNGPRLTRLWDVTTGQTINASYEATFRPGTM
jgi:hypothetical protein